MHAPGLHLPTPAAPTGASPVPIRSDLPPCAARLGARPALLTRKVGGIRFCHVSGCAGAPWTWLGTRGAPTQAAVAPRLAHLRRMRRIPDGTLPEACKVHAAVAARCVRGRTARERGASCMDLSLQLVAALHGGNLRPSCCAPAAEGGRCNITRIAIQRTRRRARLSAASTRVVWHRRRNCVLRRHRRGSGAVRAAHLQPHIRKGDAARLHGSEGVRCATAAATMRGVQRTWMRRTTL